MPLRNGQNEPARVIIIFMKILLLLWSLSLFANIEKYFRKMEEPIEAHSIEGVDFTYLINLDARKERLAHSLQQLFPYGIWPGRFPAIYGWHLPFEAYEEIGLKFQPGMWIGIENALSIAPGGFFHFVRLSEAFYGKTVFSSWLTPGGVGCTLSHLSVLQDAYDAGYQTIWILEDDFVIVKDPHLLSGLIQKLDQLADWDVLYTDPDYLYGLDRGADLQTQLPYKWRPDRPGFDLESLLEHTPVGDDFFKIGNRNRTHSMIIRRSGFEKILRFYKEHGLFLPYDHELGFIPHLSLFVVKESIVEAKETTSDTKDRYF